MEPVIRHATPTDLGAINGIYNSYIVGRHTSFDLEPWPIEARRSWFERYGKTGRYQVLVADVAGVIAGFASSSPFRDKAAYATSVESTVVLNEPYVGKGIGRDLLESLLNRLRRERIHRVYALIALPNDRSVELHERLGYRRVGVLDEVGHKLGSYHSVLVMELPLDEPIA